MFYITGTPFRMGAYNAPYSVALITADIQPDLIGYGKTPPHPQWPNTERLAINFVINIEEGAEQNILQGNTGSENYLINTVRCLYREGKKALKMKTVALHTRISGHPGRAEVIHRFLDYLAVSPDIWICTRQKISQHCYQQHPDVVM
ncbi:MAG: hypothetical protein HOE45_08215 [Gammaproteobacteria bacterium]|nr:hypothetical protein [Gammaproteobacteria bacterium]MBT5221386.1 hypothetical protein [Gammaproteobacteria bacterium]MBT5825959.1 hypothetical protein [Gammaproteobacteria bacterium]MBT6419769.1 hypothetical protein [Gammaproteobacteria bacterium]MBT6574950.1 hypothetical protein [Gammaproteobacteria bacterium]